MKAKPTIYGHIRFRSRLEARWARFFDAIAQQWMYEPVVEGIDVGYLPDFALVRDGQARMWVETKPMTDAPLSDPRWQQFVDATKLPLLLIAGVPGQWEGGQLVSRGYQAAVIRQTGYPNGRAAFVECPGCGSVSVEVDGARMCCSSDGRAVDAAFGEVRDMELVDA